MTLGVYQARVSVFQAASRRAAFPKKKREVPLGVVILTMFKNHKAVFSGRSLIAVQATFSVLWRELISKPVSEIVRT